MITAFEVGATFRILNEASPQLSKILGQVRELQAAVDKAKISLSNLGNVRLAALTGETQGLATAWREVGKAASSANRSINVASRRQLAGPGVAGVAEAQSLADAWERIASSSAVAAGSARRLSAAAGRSAAMAGGGGAAAGGGGGNRNLFHPGARGGFGGGAHIGGPGVPIPGGAHLSFRGGAAAAAGLLGYGVYEAAKMEDAVFQLNYHAGLEQNDANRKRFRDVLQESMLTSGFGLHDISEAAKQEIRMFQGTPGGGLDVLPEMLRAATVEARLKGESPEESMKALIGLAHMTKQYDPEAIRKLAPAFAFLSTANPGSLSSIERAAGYAVPLLQSGLEIDPMQSLVLGTALTRAGATNTKSGTWLREMALRAMPGTSMMSKMAFKKHEEALKAFGLVDDNDKPTWFTDGKPDLLKMLDIAGGRASAIPLEKRAAYERALFGAQGGGGFALLSDPAVRGQVQALQKEMNSPEFKNRYGGFVQAYQEGSTVQQARTAMQDFNVTMMEIGKDVLPSVNVALHNFKSLIEGIRDLIPGVKNDGKVGGAALTGAVPGAIVGGVIAGPPGAVVGGAGGALVGGVLGLGHEHGGWGIDPAGSYTSPGKTGRPARPKDEEEQPGRQKSETSPQNPVVVKTAPVTLNLNIDGRTLATTIGELMNQTNTFPTQAPAADGLGQHYGGDHNFNSK